MRRFEITFEDTKIIREFEGHSLKAYPDPATGGEPWTISYGLTGSWVVPGLEISEEVSKTKFMEYIGNFCQKIDNILTCELNKNQYIAVLSLTWNIGVGNLKSSTLLKLLNSKDFSGASNQFLRWNKAAGKVMNGLTRRREAEKKLFDTQIIEEIQQVKEEPKPEPIINVEKPINSDTIKVETQTFDKQLISAFETILKALGIVK